MIRAAALVLAASLVALAARADTPPTKWDRARDPRAAAAWDLHVQVRDLIVRSRDPAQMIFPRNPALMKARVLLEDAGARRADADLRLRFDLGEIDYRLEEWHGAIEILSSAIDRAPDDPAAPYILLANAYAHLDRSGDERRLYLRYLPRIIDERTRASVLINLAEADMHLGDLAPSIAEYREAKDVAARLPNIVALNEPTGTLAVWGLAVALDRDGDAAGSAVETRLALQLDPGMRIITSRGEGSPVFFSPERERDWYVGLGYAEYAKQAAEPEQSAQLWYRAERCWHEYLEDVEAHAAHDLWVDLARARLEKAHSARVASEHRARKPLHFGVPRCTE